MAVRYSYLASSAMLMKAALSVCWLLSKAVGRLLKLWAKGVVAVKAILALVPRLEARFTTLNGL